MRWLQRAYYFCHIPLIVASLAIFVGCAHRQRSVSTPSPTRISPKPEPFIPPSHLPKVEQPSIRIGLITDVKSVTLAADKAVYYTEGGKVEATRSQLTVAVSFVLNVSLKYSVQLGSFSTSNNAHDAQNALRRKSSQPSFIKENPDLHSYQLRLGPYSSKEKAQQVIEDIRGAGYPDAYYTEEDSANAELPDLIVRDELGRALMKTRHSVAFWAEEGAIQIDSDRYRGYVSIFVNDTGRLTVVNVLSFEDYLKGVVPNEIGPATAATYEALKAQAVAARTYAYKNLHQFESEGYDICATPRCQVYSGLDTESPLTTKAVEETKGQIVTYGGEPINALYTSTCGGRTEDAQYMFEGWNYPYLKSVECYPEENEPAHSSVQLQGRRQDWALAWLAAKLGRTYSGDFSRPVTAAEVTNEVYALLSFLGKHACNNEQLSDPDWIGVGNYLVSQLCWQSKRDSLLNEKDYRYFLSHLTFSIDPSPKSHSFLFLFHDGILVPSDLYHFNPYARMSRAEFLNALFQILKHYHQVNSQDGQMREANGGGMQVVDDFGVHMYAYHDPVYLFQKVGDQLTPSDRLACSPGDQVQYFIEDNQIQILVCELNQAGAAVDRSSKLSFWQETYTPSELGQKVAKYLDVGDVQDLQPLSFGVSRRVYEMKIIGNRSSGVLRGIRVRWALGLKDNLFVIDRTYDSSGKVKQFIFTGRGWGHGVGMCQIGAMGYSKQGWDYKRILLHYYTGVQISTAY